MIVEKFRLVVDIQDALSEWPNQVSLVIAKEPAARVIESTLPSETLAQAITIQEIRAKLTVSADAPPVAAVYFAKALRLRLIHNHAMLMVDESLVDLLKARRTLHPACVFNRGNLLSLDLEVDDRRSMEILSHLPPRGSLTLEIELEGATP